MLKNIEQVTKRATPLNNNISFYFYSIKCRYIHQNNERENSHSRESGTKHDNTASSIPPSRKFEQSVQFYE